MDTGYEVEGGFGCDRAFKRGLRENDLNLAITASREVWGDEISVMDPMAGGGSIPLESARLGFHTMANEYNPVACSILEATVDYPFRLGQELATKSKKWGKIWEERVEKRLGALYPVYKFAKVHAYIYARTVPCPQTQANTPLVPDWHLLKPKTGRRVVAKPVVDLKKKTWSVQIHPIGAGAGQMKNPPQATYNDGKGISLFAPNMQIAAEYIKAIAQAGEMKSALYAVALKTSKRLEFRAPEPKDLEALEAAEQELRRLRPGWEKDNVIPTEKIPVGDKTGEATARGITAWADMFSPRQLLCFGVLVEELRKLRPEIIETEGQAVGEAVVHLLGFSIDKFTNYNSILCSWHAPHSVMRSVFDRHDYSFKPTFAEMAPCGSGSGLEWATDNVLDAYEAISNLPRTHTAPPVEISLGSSTSPDYS